MIFTPEQKDRIDHLIEGRLLREKRRQDGERRLHIAESAGLAADRDRLRAELAAARADLDQYAWHQHQRLGARLGRWWQRISNIWGGRGTS
jgi:hypothetical protein